MSSAAQGPFQIAQFIQPSQWTLAGLVLPQDQSSLAKRALTLIRPMDPLSVQINSTFDGRSIVPKIAITASKFKIILTNAKLTAYGPVDLGKYPEVSKDPLMRKDQQFEEIQFVYERITWKNNPMTANDDWNSS